MALWILFMLIGLLTGLHIGVSLANQNWSLNANVIQRLPYRGQFYKVVKLEDKKSWDNLSIHFMQPGSMGCGYDCHFHEKYGFVPEADCPIHDVKQEER